MIQLLASLFIRDHKNTSDSRVRQAYGVLCSGLGIFLNILLFAGKYLAGSLSGSIAITADAFNNLSDAGSSAITLVGFRLAGKKPDKDHPFGHGRLEYLVGLGVSILILIMGFELGKSAVETILHPTPMETGPLALGILLASVLVKLYMFLYNRTTARRIDSAAMKATAKDSLSDAASTTAVLLCALVSRFTSVQLDGWCGLLVAALILLTGISAVKDTVSPLLGEPPSRAFIQSIEDYFKAYPLVVGIHDLIVHDYGPGRRMISVHAEVPADGDILELHDMIDNIERGLGESLGCDVVIHMDPVTVNDERTNETRRRVSELAATLGEGVSIHDFRMVEGPSHTNLIFDLVLPFDSDLKPEQARAVMNTLVEERMESCFAVITVDQLYI